MSSTSTRVSCDLSVRVLLWIAIASLASCQQCTGPACHDRESTEQEIGLETVISVMQAQQGSINTQMQGCLALKNLLDAPENKVRLLRAGGLQLILNTLDIHADSAPLQELGIEILELLVEAAESDGWDGPLLKGVAFAALEAMLTHRIEASVQARCCSLIRRLGENGMLQQMDVLEEQDADGDEESIGHALAPDIVASVTAAMKDWGESEEVQSECGILQEEAWFIQTQLHSEGIDQDVDVPHDGSISNSQHDNSMSQRLLVLNANSHDPAAVEDGCRAVTELASDEDQSHLLATRDVPRDVQHAMRRYMDDAFVQEACLLALWQLCTMPSSAGAISRSVVQAGGVQEAVQDFGCRVLTALMELDEGLALALEHRAAPTVLAAVASFAQDPDVLEQAARVLVAMARDAVSRRKLDEAGAVQGALQLFSAAGSDVRVREQGCHLLKAMMEGSAVRLEEREEAVSAVLSVLGMHGGDFNLRMAASKILLTVAREPTGRAALVAQERGVAAIVGALRVSGEHGRDREMALQTLELLSREDPGRRSLAEAREADRLLLRVAAEESRAEDGVGAGVSEACWVLWRMGAVNGSVLAGDEAMDSACWWACRDDRGRSDGGNREREAGFGARDGRGRGRQRQDAEGFGRVGCLLKRKMMASAAGRRLLEVCGEGGVGGLRIEDVMEVGVMVGAVLVTVLVGGIGGVWLLRAVSPVDEQRGVPAEEGEAAVGGRGRELAGWEGGQGPGGAVGRGEAGARGEQEVGGWEEGSEGYCRARVSVLFLAELRRATNNFAADARIGGGGFGCVFKVEQGLRGVGNGRALAVKKLDADKGQGQGEFLQEIQVLGSLKHPHLLPLLAFSAESRDSVCLVTPLMRGGSLEDRLLLRPRNLQRLATLGFPRAPHDQVRPLTWRERVRICVGAGRGIAYLHASDDACGKPQILHRDVKAANIMLDGGTARLCDAGLARVSDELRPQGDRSHVSSRRVVGTHGFLDPAYMATGRMDTATDGYALGVTMMMALTGQPALDQDAAEPLLTDRCHEALFGVRDVQAVADGRAGWPARGAEAMLEGARRLLHPVRGNRWSVARVVEHLEAALALDRGHDEQQEPQGSEEAGANRAGDELEGGGAGKECVMCMEELRQVRFEACGHAVLCANCYLSLRDSVDPFCPYCRGPISPASAPSDSIARQDTFVRVRSRQA